MCPGASAYTDTVHWLQIFLSCALPCVQWRIAVTGNPFYVSLSLCSVCDKQVCVHVYIYVAASPVAVFGFSCIHMDTTSNVSHNEHVCLNSKFCYWEINFVPVLVLWKCTNKIFEFTVYWSVWNMWCWYILLIMYGSLCMFYTHTHLHKHTGTHTHAHTHERLLKTFLIKKKWT